MTDPKDIELLWKFILRTEMYTVVSNKDTIVSFLHGYEAGRNGECDFIERLSNSITEDYQIDSKATGWIGQIHLLADKLGFDWTATFKRQSFKVLNEHLSGVNLEEFHESIRGRIKAKISSIKDHFGEKWEYAWLETVNLNAEWFRRIWTKRELQTIEEIQVELKAKNYEHLDGKSSPSENSFSEH